MADNLSIINCPSPATATAGPTPSSRPVAFREDCWTEDATATLVEVWGRRYVDLNRGNLRQKDWQEVADAVNERHGHTKKTMRTDVQCKNRIDTLKKKYKVEKARVSGSNGQIGSNWPFYSRMDVLIGADAAAKKSSSSASPPSAVPLPYRKPPSTAMSPRFPPAILPMKRSLPVDSAVDGSYFRRNYSAVAAAAAAAEEDGSEEDESLGSSDDDGGAAAGGGGVRKDRFVEPESSSDAMKRLSRAIERFGEIYERVEGEKQKQMIELEKQRMQFTKDLEIQRMQLFMDTQVQLEKIKQAKRTVSDDDDVYS